MLGTLTWSNNQSAPSIGGITPTAGGIVILMAGFGAGSGVPNVSSVTDTWGDSGGGPWTQHVNAANGSLVSRCIVYSRVIGSNPASGAVTVNLGSAANRGAMGIYEHSGQHSTTPTDESDSATSDDGAANIVLTGIPLGSGNNIACSVAGRNDSDGITPGANTTEVAEISSGSSNEQRVAFCTAAGNPTWSDLDGNVALAGAVEIVADSGAPGGFAHSQGVNIS
jgi:hypothetical protein